MNQSERRGACPVAATSFQGGAEGAMTGRIPPLFTDLELQKLRELIGESQVNKIVSRLGAAVRFYVEQKHKRSHNRDRTRPHIDAIERLERQRRGVLRVLQQIDPLAREAVLWGVLPAQLWSTSTTNYLENSAATTGAPSGLPSLYDLAMPPWKGGETARATLQDLAPQLKAWKNFVLLSPGRKVRTQRRRLRVRLNRWVGKVFKDAGLRWSTRRNGLLARVIRRVDEAAGLPVQKDIFRDLQDVGDWLKKSLEKRAKRKKSV